MSNVPRQPPPKKEVALALLEESSMFIHLDPRRPDVIVPKWFTGQPQLVLQVGLNMAIPIPDLKIDEFGITCTLSFNRAPFWCKIPWTAIYALVGAEDGRGGVWPDDVPPEIQLQQQRSSSSGPQRSSGQKRPRPKLAAVDGETVPDRSERSEPEERRAPKRGAQARPVLAAVPPPSEEAAEPEEEAPPPEPSKSPSGGKKKREIPPYLRVIK